MKYGDLKRVLASHTDMEVIVFVLPDGEEVPMHFHVTEVGIVEGSFVDCGGVARKTNSVHIQLWVGSDSHHRFGRSKMEKLLDSCEQRLSIPERFLGAEVLVEYGERVAVRYSIREHEATESKILFHLIGTGTQCRAKDRGDCGSDTASCC